jgi:SPP1 gp7 family putative phage head morphogenesis protein
MLTVNELLHDKAIEHAIGLVRYSSATVRRIIALLNRTDPDIVAQIQARVGDINNVTDDRLAALLVAIRDLNRRAYEAVSKALEGDLIELAHYEADYQAKTLTDALSVTWDVTAPAPSTLAAAVNSRPFQGALLHEWVAGLEEGRARRLRDAIRMGLVEGETTDQIVRRVRGTKALNYRDGVLDISRRSAEAVVRTAVSHVAARARQETFEANEDLVKGWKFVATLDQRTSAQCRALDGKVFKVGDDRMLPPRHVNCRSSTSAVTKSWRELGLSADEVDGETRASMDGQVPAETTYEDWLRSKPAAFQDDILGAEKGKLFRAGGLSLDAFVDRKGREYSLDELRRREAAAFRKAGLDEAA